MKHDTYAENAAIDAEHWWYVGRRKLFARVISELGLQVQHAAVLDAGTSTGPNLGLLRELGFTDIHAVDLSPEAVRICKSQGFHQVRLGDVCALPYAEGTFDLVLATDVIEHVDDDGLALRELRRVLKPGGTALITVPAFPSLWGVSDEIGEHKRRYRIRPLSERITKAGLEADQTYHFNYLLFVPIFLVRQLTRLFRGRVKNENHINTPLLNRVLTSLFSLDVRTASIVRPPAGVSIMALCKKPSTSVAAKPVASRAA
jgi:SAM-dependent methyltransferase